MCPCPSRLVTSQSCSAQDLACSLCKEARQLLHQGRQSCKQACTLAAAGWLSRRRPKLQALHVLVSAHPARLQETDKYRSLVKLLEREMDGSRILVFCETKRGCDAVSLRPQPAQSSPCHPREWWQPWCPHLHVKQALGFPRCVATCRRSQGVPVPAHPALWPLQATKSLRMDGWPALSIHGDKSQQERDWVLGEFKSAKTPIMLATDVAARGLGRELHARHKGGGSPSATCSQLDGCGAVLHPAAGAVVQQRSSGQAAAVHACLPSSHLAALCLPRCCRHAWRR